ncbi:P-loop containing nucleoside triphosphate hydrolase protein [Infundibulicybe gibba]|nr:P-loop containing nucleoside triphosphate hydrolase protein [Infundibulicybe gibba]
MPPHKRKRQSPVSDGESSYSYEERVKTDDEDDIDISLALIGKKQKLDLDASDNDEELNQGFKGGTDVVKKAKGKTKITKGELGGGSFQSMGLHPSLLRSLTLQGYRIPTPIQRLSIPALLTNPPRDLVGMARTGSGKSLAYMVPLIQRLGGRHATAFELARGWQGGHAGDTEGIQESGKGRTSDGDYYEQFEMIANNPDVIIATPGRLLHVIVEMNLDLKSVQYVVFDEADRLFEMGFETALTEILHRLPPSRQTLLFSATLPKSLVEFAKAGLQDPKLVRLDAESKISSDLRWPFFLLNRLKKTREPSEGKGKSKRREQFTAPHQTLIFVATKHHVEYLMNLLTTAGYAVSHIYGSLDQMARTYQMDQFRRGITSILVVTDVAARGIDIPVLENVINYDFPQGARVFVHRVGRTARAGRQGWAWSFLTHVELPYLLDLQLFLGRPLRCDVGDDSDQVYTESLILGTFEREKIDEDMEYVKSLETVNHSLPTLREVMKRGHAMYERSKGKASPPSYKRAKDMSKDPRIHPVLLRGADSGDRRAKEEARKLLLQTVNSFRPPETVFEVGSKGNTANAALMRERRKALSKSAQRALASTSTSAVFEVKKDGFRDSDYYMSHYQKGAVTEKGYSLRDGASSFAEQARGATFDLTGDDGSAERKKRQLNWDKKKKRFVKGDGVGADNIKLVKTENGTKLPASYRSGRFDEWKAKSRISLPKVGEAENENAHRRGAGPGGHRFRHNKVIAAKPLDRLNKDYERKTRQLKQKEDGGEPQPSISRGKSKPAGRYGGKPYGRVKTELKTTEQIRKGRRVLEKKRAKNARPSHGSKKGRR